MLALLCFVTSGSATSSTIITKVLTSQTTSMTKTTTTATSPLPASWPQTVLSTTKFLVSEWPAILSLLSIALFPYLALLHQTRLDTAEVERLGEKVDVMRAWQDALAWRPFMGLAELWVFGRISWGPWDADSITRRWEDKRYMKRFLRAGIIPLHIDGGGVKTYKKTGGEEMRPWWSLGAKVPVWVQSVSRAHFDFVVVCPDGFGDDPIYELDMKRRAFKKGLKGELGRRFAVCYTPLSPRGRTPLRPFWSAAALMPSADPLEVGAESSCKFMLPFKRDVVLKKGMGNLPLSLDPYLGTGWRDRLPLLAGENLALVRVEALDFDKHGLDEEVFQMATNVKLGDVWMEDELSSLVGAHLEDHRVPVLRDTGCCLSTR